MNDLIPNQSESQLTAQGNALVSRQSQEVQAAMVIAKKFPRDENAAFNRIMKACSRKGLAEQASYAYPKGGTKVTGPSIRLAEALIQAWGNCDFGIVELEQNFGESSVMAYAWDLETNTRQTKVFTVKHEIKAKGEIKRLSDPRDIYELVANQGARRMRACILGIIPGDIVDAAEVKCDETLRQGNSTPISDRIKIMLEKFLSDFSVNKELIEKRMGMSTDAFTENEVLALGKIYNSLRDKMAKREDFFDIKLKAETVTEKTNAEKEFEKMKATLEGAKK